MSGNQKKERKIQNERKKGKPRKTGKLRGKTGTGRERKITNLENVESLKTGKKGCPKKPCRTW